MRAWFVLAAIGVTACGNATLTTGVFADTTDGVLFSEQDFKGKSGCVTPDNCLSDSSGLRGARLYLGRLSDGGVEVESQIEGVPDLAPQAYGNLAFVSSQGYAMYTERDGTVVFHHLDGEPVRVATPGNSREGAFPSLDGRMVALVGDQAGQTIVRFVDPTDGQIIEEFSFDLVKGPLPEIGRARVVWTDDGLGVWGGLGTEPMELGGVLFRPGTTPERRDNLPCDLPTPSFAIRDGLALPDGEETGNVEALPTDASVCSKSPRFPARPGPLPI